MRRLPLALVVFIVGILVSVSQILMLGPMLPAKVASHFGADGRADGSMSRESFLACQWGITAFIAVLFFGLPRLIRATPDDLINLPHKDRWLAPERRAATLAYIADRLFAFGSATLTLLVSLFQLIYTANIRGTLVLGNSVWLFLLLYLVYTAIWSAALVKRFQHPA
jgi:hypothetical protein